MKRTQVSTARFEEETSDTLSTNLPGSSYNSFGTHSPPLSASPDHETDSISDNSKKIRKKRNTYQKIDDGTRMKLLDAVQQGETLKAAAKRYDINYSSAKSILHTYRKEGRILKKSAQERIARRRTKASSDLEMSPIYLDRDFQVFNDTEETAMDFQQRGELGQEEWASKAGTSGVTINSFGGFLKVDSQGRTPSETSNPTSTIVLKLDSNKFQRVSNNSNNNINVNSTTIPTMIPSTIPTINFPSKMEPVNVPVMCTTNTKNIQSGSLKLNVNVQKEQQPKSTVKTFNNKEGSRITYNFNTKPLEAKNNVESFQINFSTSPNLLTNPNPNPNLNQRRYDMPTNPHMSNGFQDDDVSCFLNSSSPTYPYQPRLGDVQNLTANDGYQGYVDQQELYGRMNKGSFMGNYGRKMEQGAPGLIKAAGLKSY